MSSSLTRIVPALIVSGVAFTVVTARQQGAPLQGVPAVADAATYAPLATRIDPYVPKPRVIYPEAGSGLPNPGGGRRGSGPLTAPGAPGARGAGRATGIPSAPPGGRGVATPRVTVSNGSAAVATVVPNTPGIAHVILAVTDNGTPSLTSYRRVILSIQNPGN